MGVSPVVAVDFEFHSFTCGYWAGYFVKVIRGAQTHEPILALKFPIKHNLNISLQRNVENPSLIPGYSWKLHFNINGKYLTQVLW